MGVASLEAHHIVGAETPGQPVDQAFERGGVAVALAFFARGEAGLGGAQRLGDHCGEGEGLDHGLGGGTQWVGRRRRRFGQALELFVQEAHQMIGVVARPAGAGHDRVDPPADPVETQLQPARAALGPGEAIT
jgi:hypothetical protein